MTILFFGDIMGKIGRRAIKKILPSWKKKYKPDFIIANGENLAHGVGITEKTAREIFEAGVDFLTGGNHTFDKPVDFHIWSDSVFGLKMIRPYNINYQFFLPHGVSGRETISPPMGDLPKENNYQTPGQGYRIINVKKGKLMIVNLMGRVFFKEEYGDPFKAINEILENKPAIVKCALLDFHAEATSEKNALGWYLDGKISAVIGTHTHIPTSDEKILPNGTAYITDVGMVGTKDSVLGEDKDVIIESFLKGIGFKHCVAERGEAIVNAVLIKIDEKTGKAKSIERLEEVVEV